MKFDAHGYVIFLAGSKFTKNDYLLELTEDVMFEISEDFNDCVKTIEKNDNS